MKGRTLLGETGTEADEVAFARAAARHVGARICEVPLFEPTIDWFVEQARIELDLPTYTNGAMSISLEKSMVDQGCRVTLGGTGGDQWLDGTFDYYLQHLRSHDFVGFLSAMKRDILAYGAGFTVPLALRQIAAALLPKPVANRFRRTRLGEMDGFADDVFWLSRTFQTSLEKGFAGLQNRYSGDAVAARKRLRLERAETQLAFDLMNRQHTRLHLESRSPMFARPFIEFNAATPEHIRLRSGQTKWVHRQAMQGIMPSDIVWRDTKASFPATSLVQQAREYCRYNSSILAEALGEEAGLNEMLTETGDAEFDLDTCHYLWGCFASAAYLTATPSDGEGRKENDDATR